jgi:hypothetical protein
MRVRRPGAFHQGLPAPEREEPRPYRCERLAGGRDPELNSVQDPGGAPA